MAAAAVHKPHATLPCTAAEHDEMDNADGNAIRHMAPDRMPRMQCQPLSNVQAPHLHYMSMQQAQVHSRASWLHHHLICVGVWRGRPQSYCSAHANACLQGMDWFNTEKARLERLLESGNVNSAKISEIGRKLSVLTAFSKEE